MLLLLLLPSLCFSQSTYKKRIIHAIIKQESNYCDTIQSRKENAVGLLQIRPIMITEINRITKKHYSLNDRFSRKKSIAIFIAYQDFYNPKWSYEVAARIWNGGASGMNKESTVKYWNKVKQLL